MVATAITPDALAAAVVSLRHKRANDPWDGPNGTAREKQRPPDGAWQIWMILAGRGFGKTRTGAEWIRKRVQAGDARRIVLAGPTAADIRDIMIEGESGLQAVCDQAGVHMTYNPSKRRVTFANGATAVLVSADEPKRFRGLQCDTFWADELASWRYPDAWDQLQLGHRLGTDPRGIVTTTPRPIEIIKSLVKDDATVTVRGSTYENADHLAARFMEQVVKRYEGTTLGRQELYAEILEDVEGAFWTRKIIDAGRITNSDNLPDMERVVVAIDPATTFGENSDETGIAVAGISSGNYYLLHGDGRRESPQAWADRALRLYDEYEADAIIAESNQGGEMVRQTILNGCRDRRVKPRIQLIHASRGKQVRAEPVVALYEQGRVHHSGVFGSLEDQMCTFPVGDGLDDQVDAMVHAITGVMHKRLATARSF